MRIELIRKRTTILLVIGLASIFVLLASILSGAQADKQFTNKSFEGTYGFSSSGTIAGLGTVVTVGLITADGAGNCSVKQTLNIAGIGQIGPRTSSMCTYNVNPDGTFTQTTVFDPSEGSAHNAGVIVNKENEIRVIRTDLNATMSSVYVRQRGSQ